MAVANNSLQHDVQSLYSDHHGWLFGWLRKKMGCAHNAADIAQDTFLRIITSRDALIGMQEPRAYLTTTAKRLLLNRARRQVIEQNYLAQLAITTDRMGSYPAPEELLQAIEALEQISAALQAVAVNARQAFLLHYLDGQTHAAIAAELGVSTKTVQKYLIQTLLSCRGRDVLI